jgi:hypothetical protein
LTASIEASTELINQHPADATLAVVARGGVTVDTLRRIAGDEKIQAIR